MQTNSTRTGTPHLDREELDRHIAEMYRDVANEAIRDLHFPTGRLLAEALGYPARLLERLPAHAVSSFAGVGYHLDLVRLLPGECVLDLGSGSGMDVFAAAAQVGPRGSVVGVDITPEQLAKAERLRHDEPVSFRHARIEELPFESGSFDVVTQTASSICRPTSDAYLPRQHACCGLADGLRSRTSPPSGRSRHAPRARPSSGPPASPAPVREIST
jgi:SAM-dependent methyltransferase